jgi:DNA-binding NtrC family response regulator
VTCRVAVIDDDPIEFILLSEFAEEIDGEFEFKSFLSPHEFVADKSAAQFDLVFLDRRIPPYDRFAQTLPLIAMTGFRGRLIMMSAHPEGFRDLGFDFALIGPVDKLALLSGDALKAILLQPNG